MHMETMADEALQEEALFVAPHPNGQKNSIFTLISSVSTAMHTSMRACKICWTAIHGLVNVLLHFGVLL